MKYQSYNKEFSIATAQVLDVFNDIRINRLDNASNSYKSIKVACLYGQRSRILKSLENRHKILQLPMIAISRSGIVRDSSRVFSTKAGLYKRVNGGPINHDDRTPIPINITFNMEILTKYITDMDQIISNFIPFMNPEVYVVWPHPKYPTTKTMKSQVVWNGQVDETFPEDIGEDEPYRMTATTSFTYKTWIFPGEGVGPQSDRGIIKRINFNPSLTPICPLSGDPADYSYGLSNWHEVPTNMPFDKYQEYIVKGFIKDFDELQISAGLSGYWMDISGLVSGDVLLDEEYGTDLSYMVDDIGNLLVLSDGILNEAMQEQVSYIDYYNSTLSGELSGYKSF